MQDDDERITATDVLRRQKEQTYALADIAKKNPIGFMLAANHLIERQWNADAARFTALTEVSDGSV